MEKDIQDLCRKVVEESNRGVYDSLPKFWTQWARIHPGEVPQCSSEFLYTQVPEEYLPKLQVECIKVRGPYDNMHHDISTKSVSLLAAARLLSRHYASLPENLRSLVYDFDKFSLKAKDFSQSNVEPTAMYYWEDPPGGVSFSDISTRRLRRQDLDMHTSLEISPLTYLSAANLIALAKKIRVVFLT